MGGGYSVFHGRNVCTLSPAPFGINHKDDTMTQETFYSKPTSVYMTCKLLLEGQTISQITLMQSGHGWRLGAIMHRLKWEYGWPIQTEYTSPGNVALYTLSPDADRSALRFPKSAKALGKGEGAA